MTVQFSFACLLGLISAWGAGETPLETPEAETVSQPPLSSVEWNGESVAVICPPMFRKALEPWVYYRMNQGYKIYILEEPKIRELPQNLHRESSPEYLSPNTPANATHLMPYTTPGLLKSRIIALTHKDPSLKYLLLVGDAAPDVKSEASASSRLIPTNYVEALVISSFGREKEIATDNYYADLNDDNLPELAVGRLTVDTPEELSTVVAKIFRYENNIDHGFWRRRINLIAGIGGFSPIIDAQVESAARYILSEMIGEGYDLSLTQANWKSAYCPDPEMFRSVTVERINEGCLFWVYMGHGLHTSLDYLRTPDMDYPIFASGDSQYLESRNGLPIAVFCACYTGAFDAIEDCIAEDMLRQPKGPAAVIASSRVSMPYGLASFGVELIDEALNGEYLSIHSGNTSQNAQNKGVKNIGTIFLNAKRNMLPQSVNEKRILPAWHSSALNVLSAPVNLVAEKVGANKISTEFLRNSNAKKTSGTSKKQAIRSMIDTMAWFSDPVSRRLQEQLVDHVHLFQLFGDPLLRLPLPDTITAEIPESVTAGHTLTIRGAATNAEMIVAELATPRKQPITVPKERTPFHLTNASREEFMKTYLSANNRALQYAVGRTHEKDGTFEISLTIPNNIEGKYIVRIFGTGKNGVSVGSSNVTILSKHPNETTAAKMGTVK
ncbi:MAG: C25 family cysteine peptidase [Planctomycetaceae bacterium]|nr:C25 family cysteine peptidase [Planctomycetaceae bacterium]